MCFVCRTVNVTIKNESGSQSGVKSVTLDGEAADTHISLVGDGKTHEITVIM